MKLRNLRFIFILLFLVLFSAAYGKRLGPKKVEPVSVNGIEYRAPLSIEKMGKIEAWLVAEQKLLWEQAIYPVSLQPDLEADVQWVFISHLSVVDGKLIITNERGERYAMDLATRKIIRLFEKSR